LAETLEKFDDPGADLAVWDYQSRFHRERGGVHAAYELMQRATQRMNGDDLESLIAAGLIDSENSRAALDQQLRTPGTSQALEMIRAAARSPKRSAKLLKSAIRMPLMEKLYAMYPREPNEKALARWANAVKLLRGRG